MSNLSIYLSSEYAVIYPFVHLIVFFEEQKGFFSFIKSNILILFYILCLLVAKKYSPIPSCKDFFFCILQCILQLYIVLEVLKFCLLHLSMCSNLG